MTKRDLLPLTESAYKEAVNIHSLCLIEAWSEKSFRSTLKNPHTFSLALYQEKKLIGFVVYRCLKQEAEILTISIDTEYQNKGLGSLLFSKVLDNIYQKKCDRILVDVRKSNTKACCLYKKFGFKKIGTRKDYYPTLTGDYEAADILEKIFIQNSTCQDCEI